MQSLLFAFLDELLFLFSTEFLVVRELQLRAIDREGWTLAVTACVLPRVACMSLRACR